MITQKYMYGHQGGWTSIYLVPLYKVMKFYV